ncbi:MAG: hypothetical protein M3334_14130, partial [Actinomycetota bacterium]|nr:hypothetical protein [Actinomycetota bacterium]
SSASPFTSGRSDSPWSQGGLLRSGRRRRPCGRSHPPRQSPGATVGVRPILPCYWAAFKELEEWVEKKGDNPQPPSNRTVSHPALEGTGVEANNWEISDEARYSPPVPEAT